MGSSAATPTPMNVEAATEYGVPKMHALVDTDSRGPGICIVPLYYSCGMYTEYGVSVDALTKSNTSTAKKTSNNPQRRITSSHCTTCGVELEARALVAEHVAVVEGLVVLVCERRQHQCLPRLLLVDHKLARL